MSKKVAGNKSVLPNRPTQTPAKSSKLSNIIIETTKTNSQSIFSFTTMFIQL